MVLESFYLMTTGLILCCHITGAAQLRSTQQQKSLKDKNNCNFILKILAYF